MISFGLLIFIVIAAAVMPIISQYFVAARLRFLKIYCYCVLFSILVMYLVFFIVGMQESYNGNPVFPTWGSASFIDYIPDVGAALIGVIVGNCAALVIWLSMKDYR
jgi:hypothetical protein